MKFLKHDELNTYYANWTYEFVKFKEFYYNQKQNKYVPTEGKDFILINMRMTSSIRFSENDLVQIDGMVGMFFAGDL